MFEQLERFIARERDFFKRVYIKVGQGSDEHEDTYQYLLPIRDRQVDWAVIGDCLESTITKIMSLPRLYEVIQAQSL